MSGMRAARCHEDVVVDPVGDHRDARWRRDRSDELESPGHESRPRSTPSSWRTITGCKPRHQRPRGRRRGTMRRAQRRPAPCLTSARRSQHGWKVKHDPLDKPRITLPRSARTPSAADGARLRPDLPARQAARDVTLRCVPSSSAHGPTTSTSRCAWRTRRCAQGT